MFIQLFLGIIPGENDITAERNCSDLFYRFSAADAIISDFLFQFVQQKNSWKPII
jgi:hypothetical protein